MPDSISAYCAVWLINRQPLLADCFYVRLKGENRVWQPLQRMNWYRGWLVFQKDYLSRVPSSFSFFSFPPNMQVTLRDRKCVFWHKIAFMYSMGLFSERPSLCIILILCVIYWKMNWAVFKSFFSSSLFFSAVLQHSDGATHQWTVTWASTDISTRCVLVCVSVLLVQITVQYRNSKCARGPHRA